MARDGEIRACYEVSGAGYVLHRALREWGYACEVIAPSLIPKRPGVQRKHDKRDATDLAINAKVQLQPNQQKQTQRAIRRSAVCCNDC